MGEWETALDDSAAVFEELEWRGVLPGPALLGARAEGVSDWAALELPEGGVMIDRELVFGGKLVTVKTVDLLELKLAEVEDRVELEASIVVSRVVGEVTLV